MKLFLFFHLLASPYLFAYQEVTNCETKFSRKQWRSYESAKRYIQTLDIKTSQQFQEWSRSGKRPVDIPSNPRNTYKSEWKGWDDFLWDSELLEDTELSENTELPEDVDIGIDLLMEKINGFLDEKKVQH